MGKWIVGTDGIRHAQRYIDTYAVGNVERSLYISFDDKNYSE